MRGQNEFAAFWEQYALWKKAFAKQIGSLNGGGSETLSPWVFPLYVPARPDDGYMEKIGFPGFFPYTRGIYPCMYKGKLWTMRQYAGYGSARETNRRLRYLLGQGQTGLSLAFDLPTQLGMDADHPLALGEVGKVGVNASSVWDMATIFHGIPMERVSTSMTINSPAPVMTAMYIAAAGGRGGVPPGKLSGTVQNDILKEFTVRGTYIYPPEPSMRLAVDLMEYLVKSVPGFFVISVSGYHMREAGATAVQEIAFTLANAMAYIEKALERGLDIDAVAPKISFFFSAHLHLLEEVAKFRAARRLWAKIMKERYGARLAKSCQMRFHAQTAGSALTAQQPDNNIARVTLQALAAVLGGAQSLHTNAKDEAYGLPTEASARTALRIQQIIACESGAADTIDPLAGSYAVEFLTDRFEEEASRLIEQIDRMGGSVRATESGWVRREIQQSAYAYHRAVEKGRQTIVGVNGFQNEEGPWEKIKCWTGNEKLEKAQIRRLKRLRSMRNGREVSTRLDKLKKAASGKENVMPFILEAVNAEATLGEICGAFKEVYGEYERRDTVCMTLTEPPSAY